MNNAALIEAKDNKTKKSRNQKLKVLRSLNKKKCTESIFLNRKIRSLIKKRILNFEFGEFFKNVKHKKSLCINS